jgi:hypothetical protein
LELDIIREAITIYDIKQRQLNLDGVPLNTRLLMEMFASIDRTMSEKILSFWISKFSSQLEVANTLRSHEFLYMVANTTNRTGFIERFVVKPSMDLSRDPNLPYTFKLNQEELRNQRSLNVQIQHAFNSMHHPDYTTLTSKFTMADSHRDPRKEKKHKLNPLSMSVTKLKKGTGGGLRSQLDQQNKFMKKLEVLQSQANNQKFSPEKQLLRDPQIYPEIAAKVQSLNHLLRRIRHNSGKNGIPGFVESEINAVHDTRYLDKKTVEDFLQSQTHLSKKMQSIKGFKYRYMNSLIDGNIANRNQFFGGKVSGHIYSNFDQRAQIDSELNGSEDQFDARQGMDRQAPTSIGSLDISSPTQLILNDLVGLGNNHGKEQQSKSSKGIIRMRPTTCGSKRPGTAATRPWTALTQTTQWQRGSSAASINKGHMEFGIDRLVDRELAFFEQGL